MISRKSIISTACGIVLAMGLVVILVLILGLPASYLPISAQEVVPPFIFIFSLIMIAPLVSRRLNMLADINKILGWTFIGIGAEFMAFPISLLFVLKSADSPWVFLVSVMVILFSFVFGAAAGAVSIAVGMFLLRRRSP